MVEWSGVHELSQRQVVVRHHGDRDGEAGLGAARMVARQQR